MAKPHIKVGIDSEFSPAERGLIFETFKEVATALGIEREPYRVHIGSYEGSPMHQIDVNLSGDPEGDRTAAGSTVNYFLGKDKKDIFVFLNRKKLQTADDTARVLAHELVHVKQMIRDGLVMTKKRGGGVMWKGEALPGHLIRFARKMNRPDFVPWEEEAYGKMHDLAFLALKKISDMARSAKKTGDDFWDWLSARTPEAAVEDRKHYPAFPEAALVKKRG